MSKPWFVPGFALLLLQFLFWVWLPMQAWAACSSYVGKVVFNEMQDPSTGTAYIELRILDPSVVTSINPFLGWKIDVYKNNASTKASGNLDSIFTNIVQNSCGQSSTWIRIPDALLNNYIAGSGGSNNLNFVLYETTGGNKIVDIFRFGAATSFYGAGTNYASCPTIETALPSSRYDSAWISNGYKDWYRTPDGTGVWGQGQTANNVNSVCSSNDGNAAAQIGLNKVASVSSVATNTNFDFTLYAQNGATGTAQTNVVVSDNLTAAGLTFVSCTPTAPNTCAYNTSTGILTWTVGTVTNPLPLNTTRSAVLTVKAATAGTKTNTLTSNTTGTPSVSSVVTVTAAGPDHVELIHDGGGLTCTPKAVTVLACTTAASCNGVVANQYTAGSFPISLTPITGAQWCTDSLCATTLTSPATVTNGTVIYLKDTNVRTDRMAGTSSSASNTTLQCTNTATTAFNATLACDVAFAASGFLVSLPNHVSCTNSTLTVQAVQANNNATNCVPTFRNQSRAETISFAYSNPASGTILPTVGGTAISTDGTSVNLSFDSTGVATPAFVYQDVGRLSITVTDPALSMTGSTSTLPIIAPASFAFSGIPAAPLTAGAVFNATVTSMNACATPAVTQNFQSSSVIITSSNPIPALGNATAISTTLGAFSSGAASTNLTWNEVGTIDLTANLANYLGASPAMSVSGVVTGVGRFKPAYFDTMVTPGCSSGVFTYAGLTGTPSLAGQPFTVTVKAKRYGADATDATNTANYAGATWAKAVTLSDAAAGTGTLTNTALAATDFTNGFGIRSDVTYSFASKLAAPYSLTVRATDADTVPVSSSGHAEGGTAIRSGRLRLSNFFGVDNANLSIPVQAQYWTGSAWALNSADNGCTSIPTSAVVLSGQTGSFNSTNMGSNHVKSAGTMTNGVGTIVLWCPYSTTTCPSPTPSPRLTGSVDIAVNLGSSGSDQSCLNTNGGIPAVLPWLRSQNGSCAATYDRDPSARATFGIYAPETRKSVHVREQF